MHNKYDNIDNKRSGKMRTCRKRRDRAFKYKRRRAGSCHLYMYIPVYAALRRFVLKYLKLFIILAVLTLIWKAFMVFEDHVGNSLENAAEIKMREYVENIVVHSVNKVLNESADGSCGIYEYNEESNSVPVSTNLSSVKKIIEPVFTEDGRVAMVTLNTDIINKTGNEIAAEVNNDAHDGKVQTLQVSIGAMFGSRILSQMTPMVKFNMIPVSVSEVSYKTEFEDAGINQTKYKVYIVVHTEARVMAPFLNENVKVENTVLAAETVIVGDVPETYADIPEDDIPDFVS